jgi:ubiquinone/menaquinone biosynthesis C-methylase UbiE
MTKTEETNESPSKTGLVLHKAVFYDLFIWLVTLGREKAFREGMLHFAHLRPGESVLDVGCGTGTLAIAAKRQVGTTGTVYGVDASPEMIARAEKKARKDGVKVVFKRAFAQELPFPDAQFDVVLTTVMLHHLPRTARQELAVEMRRILKPGGRVLAIDFGGTDRKKKTFLDHFHRRHGHVDLKDMIEMLNEAGLNISESGAVGMRDLNFVLAMVPCCA